MLPPALLAPGAPGRWLLKLGARLEAERPELDLLDDYDCGDHPLPTGHRRAAESYRRFQRQSRTNFTGLVTESVLERLQVEGFRMGAEGQGADTEATRIWQANALDADSELLHRAALVMKRAYTIVGRDLENESTPLITAEDPREVIHACDPQRRRRVTAALKTWCEEEDGGRHQAVVYLPDAVWYFRSTKCLTDVDQRWNPDLWQLDTRQYEDGWAAPPIPGVVPVVPFVNRPDLRGRGRSEFGDVIDIQNRINNVILNRLVVAAMQAFRQRVVTGPELEDGDMPFDMGADLVWYLNDSAFKVQELGQADLTPLLKAVEADVQHLAAITRTPPHYLVGQIVNASGDALKAAETGLVSKAHNRMRQFGESWERTMALAFRMIGREAAVDAETLWGDPESRSMAELADAAVKKQAVGVPWRQLMADLQYTPAQINRMEVERSQDMLTAALAAPPAAPNQPAALPAAPAAAEA